MQPLHDHHQPSRTLAPRPSSSSSSSLRLLASLNSALNKLPKLRRKRGRTSTGSEEEKRTGSRQRGGTTDDEQQEPPSTRNDDETTAAGVVETVDSSTAASAAFQEHCTSSPPTEDKDDPITTFVEGVLYEGNKVVDGLETSSPSIKETEPSVATDEPVSSTSSPTASTTASLADMIRDMYAGTLPLDLDLLTRYTSPILSRWSTDTYKWDRQALWNLLTTFFERAEEARDADEGAEEALLVMGEMKARVLREEWLRINLDRTRRDNDYDDRVSSLILAFAVLIGKLRYFHEGVGAQVYPVLNGVLDELRARSSASPLDFHILTLLDVLDTKSADLLVRLSDLNMRVILRIVVRGIESGDSEPLDAASRIACSIIDKLVLSNPHRHRWFVDEFCGPLMHASVTALRRPWQSRQLPLVKILFHRLVRLGKEPFAQPVVLETLVDLLSASRTSYSIRARLHARARLMIDEADEPVALERHIQELGAALHRLPRLRTNLRRLVRRRRLSKSLKHGAIRTPPPVTCTTALSSGSSPFLPIFPHLSFSPTLASFKSINSLDSFGLSAQGAQRTSLPSPEAVRQRPGSEFSEIFGGSNARLIRWTRFEPQTGTSASVLIKYGVEAGVPLEEAETLQFVGQETSLPVPELYAVEAAEGKNYLYMSFMPGATLDEALPAFSTALKDTLQLDLVRLAQQLVDVPLPPGTPVGGFHEPWSGNISSFDTSSRCGDRPSTVSALYHWVQNICASPPTDLFRPHLVPDPSALRFPPSSPHCGPVFTHGDLAGRNLLVDPATGQVTAFLDWERAGAWPAGVEETLCLWSNTVDGEVVEDSAVIVAALDEARRKKGEAPARADWLYRFLCIH